MSVTVFENCLLFDGVAEGIGEGMSVAVEDGLIREVSDKAIKVDGADVIDCAGRFLMPGLLDLHFHAYSASFDMHKLDHMPTPLLVSYATKHLEDCAQRGFTTVRDPGGGEVGLALAIEAGLIEGPRFLYGGKALSQTGGHGDMRPGNEEEICNCAYSGTICQVVDGLQYVLALSRIPARPLSEEVAFVHTPLQPPTVKSITVETFGVDYPEPEKLPEITAEEAMAEFTRVTKLREQMAASGSKLHFLKRCRRCSTPESSASVPEQGVYNMITQYLVADGGPDLVGAIFNTTPTGPTPQSD